jgi:hypothetical protein
LTGEEVDSTMERVRRVRNGFVFGFSAAVGAWVALAVLSLVVHSIH